MPLRPACHGLASGHAALRAAVHVGPRERGFKEEIIHEDSDLVLALYYLSLIHDAKQELQIPVIASLNATSSGGWIRCAKLIEEAGADALELNLYRVAADPTRTGADVEASELDVVRRVSKCLSMPLAVKLAPYYSSFADLAARVTEAAPPGWC